MCVARPVCTTLHGASFAAGEDFCLRHAGGGEAAANLIWAQALWMTPKHVFLLTLLGVTSSIPLSRIGISDGHFVDEHGRYRYVTCNDISVLLSSSHFSLLTRWARLIYFSLLTPHSASYPSLRIFHGFNDVQAAKGKQPSANGEAFTPKLSQDEDVTKSWAEEVGVNVMRTPMMWAGGNPDEPDAYDDAYLGTIEGIVNNMATHGIYSYLDMHQDVISSLTGSYDGMPVYLANKTEVIEEYPWPVKVPLRGWGEGYLALQTGAIFQDLYDNTHGALDQWAAFWKVRVCESRGDEGFLAFSNIINTTIFSTRFAHYSVSQVFSRPTTQS